MRRAMMCCGATASVMAIKWTNIRWTAMFRCLLNYFQAPLAFQDVLLPDLDP
uniref:Uncharacterized protein n=1 Tax=Physcomitrium patens TaxID=3218 RepID=A0A2K1IIT7_PHYPA|nr:hypothetical protein PHYPA_027877 [Physcomitrium patens]